MELKGSNCRVNGSGGKKVCIVLMEGSECLAWKWLGWLAVRHFVGMSNPSE